MCNCLSQKSNTSLYNTSYLHLFECIINLTGEKCHDYIIKFSRTIVLLHPNSRQVSLILYHLFICVQLQFTFLHVCIQRYGITWTQQTYLVVVNENNNIKTHVMN